MITDLYLHGIRDVQCFHQLTSKIRSIYSPTIHPSPASQVVSSHPLWRTNCWFALYGRGPGLEGWFPVPWCHGFSRGYHAGWCYPQLCLFICKPIFIFFVSIIGYGISWKLSWTYHEHIRWAIFFTNLRIINQSDLLELFARTNLFIVWGPHIVGIS